MTDRSRERCSICDTEASHKCSGCGQMWYCSKACQKTDWVVHKLLCSSFAAFRSPPESNQRRAVLFQQDVDHPQFIWVDTFLTMWGYEKMPLEKLFNLPGKRTEDLAPESDLLPLLNDRRKRRLRHALKLMYRDEFTKDGSMPNKSIIKSTNGKMKYGWCGPIIAVAQGINRTSDPPYEDITLHDFRDIVDYFLTYDGTSRSVSRAIIVKKVQAIRINCPAHIAATGEPKFLVEEIDTSHPVFTMQPDFDSITWNIKLPLLLFPCPPNKKWFSEKATYCNFTAACVELSCSEDLESLKNWQVIGGDALVVRCDCKDLLLEHLEVLADFCETKIHRIMTDALDALPSTTYSHILKDVFADHATMEKFKIYWETYRRKKAISDERWRGLFSPYESTTWLS